MMSGKKYAMLIQYRNDMLPYFPNFMIKVLEFLKIIINPSNMSRELGKESSQ